MADIGPCAGKPAVHRLRPAAPTPCEIPRPWVKGSSRMKLTRACQKSRRRHRALGEVEPSAA